MNSTSSEQRKQYRPSIAQEANMIEQEARMVLPGIQALLGFQLVAVFNSGFKALLSSVDQFAHLTALLLIALSAALVLAPAAYHREAKHQISKHFLLLSSRFLALAMIPLSVGVALDVYVVSRVITDSLPASLAIGASTFIVYGWIWFAFPLLSARRLRALPTHQLPGPDEASEKSNAGSKISP